MEKTEMKKVEPKQVEVKKNTEVTHADVRNLIGYAVKDLRIDTVDAVVDILNTLLKSNGKSLKEAMSANAPEQLDVPEDVIMEYLASISGKTVDELSQMSTEELDAIRETERQRYNHALYTKRLVVLKAIRDVMGSDAVIQIKGLDCLDNADMDTVNDITMDLCKKVNITPSYLLCADAYVIARLLGYKIAGCTELGISKATEHKMYMVEQLRGSQREAVEVYFGCKYAIDHCKKKLESLSDDKELRIKLEAIIDCNEGIARTCDTKIAVHGEHIAEHERELAEMLGCTEDSIFGDYAFDPESDVSALDQYICHYTKTNPELAHSLTRYDIDKAIRNHSVDYNRIEKLVMMSRMYV